MSANPLSLDNPVFRAFIASGSILTLKMMSMSVLTGRQRRKNKACANPEDLFYVKGAKLETNEDVERVRRAHLNDLENIPIFFVAGLGYILTNPDPKTAITLFKVYTAARIVHTIVYAVYVVPQPARGISFGVGFLITGFMAVKALKHFGCCCN